MVIANYVDIDFQMLMNQYNTIDFKEDADSVKQAIIDIILTRVGEREFVPLYGSRVYDILFEKINELTALQLKDEIIVALENWEPRIKVNKINVTPYLEENYYDVEIIYEMLRLNQIQTLNMQLNRI